MIYFNDLEGKKLKKILSLKSAKRRYHNKNNSGGNFAIVLITHDDVFSNLEGMYGTNGVVYRLKIGELWQPGMTIINIDNFDTILHYEIFTKIENYIK